MKRRSPSLYSAGLVWAACWVCCGAVGACGSDQPGAQDAAVGAAGSVAGAPAAAGSGGAVVAGRGGAGSAAAGRGGAGTSSGAGASAAGRGASDEDAGVEPAAGAGGTAGASGASGAAGGAAGAAGAVAVPVPDESLIGWAAMSGDGVSTTTGGGNGRKVSAANAAELMQLASSAEPLVIELKGTYAVPRLDVMSNKTLIGASGGATIEGAIRIRGKKDAFVSNVIIKNLRLHAATSEVDGDGLQIHFAHHVWVDHCEIWDGPDGNLDVVHGSNWVTVSWTKFRYTASPPDADHRFCNLVGHSDNNAAEDTGRLKVTFHHNHWVERIVERMPRVRFGEVHVFNNLYTSTGNNYAVGAALQSKVRVENNVFEGVNNPHIFYEGDPTAQLIAEGNLYTNATGDRQMGQGNAFMAPYPYKLEAVSTVAASVRKNAGPR